MTEGLSLGVELDDVFHRFRIFLPVERLQVMTGHDVDLPLPRNVGEQDYLFRVSGFQQGFHGLDMMEWLGFVVLANLIK